MITTLATHKSSFTIFLKSIDGGLIWSFQTSHARNHNKEEEDEEIGENKDISLESIANSKSQLPKADDGNHNSTTNNE